MHRNKIKIPDAQHQGFFMTFFIGSKIYSGRQ